MSINQGIIYLWRHRHPNECRSTLPKSLLALAVSGRGLVQEDVPVNLRDKFVPKFLLDFRTDGKVLLSWK